VAPDDLRVLRLRTFSKGYGLAGARIGYAVGAVEMIAAFDKIRNHFGIGRISQVKNINNTQCVTINMYTISSVMLSASLG